MKEQRSLGCLGLTCTFQHVAVFCTLKKIYLKKAGCKVSSSWSCRENNETYTEIMNKVIYILKCMQVFQILQILRYRSVNRIGFAFPTALFFLFNKILFFFYIRPQKGFHTLDIIIEFEVNDVHHLLMLTNGCFSFHFLPLLLIQIISAVLLNKLMRRKQLP